MSWESFVGILPRGSTVPESITQVKGRYCSPVLKAETLKQLSELGIVKALASVNAKRLETINKGHLRRWPDAPEVQKILKEKHNLSVTYIGNAVFKCVLEGNVTFVSEGNRSSTPSKPVEARDNAGNVVLQFDSVQKARLGVGYCLSYCLKNKTVDQNDLTWRYYEGCRVNKSSYKVY